ncbi:MerR family transcriptional regulator [Actinomadura rudentiformis]|uniref:MerR family transcriptional regulator n=1 Tax=Actinomadura rudentiformis TaxID=359158 RepID=A0A6H9YAF6_9ACTN|nr:MerR family transcriptional regulator [Actinomadura rudentiformis]KAB2340778.1 MerR family transcriptional regulator [Actinomadura rudentiformis]
MDGDTLYTIGELARRTGLPVKTIRFYSDSGVVPPTDRTHAGYRLYDLDALARLDLVRTLRELGIDLATVQRVLDREVTVAEVAAAHAEALDAQIGTLRLRRAVLRAVAKRGSGPEEMELMHKLAKLSDEERRRIINDFIDETFGGLDANPEFVAMLRSAMPELPDDPEPEQVDAWVELAELVQEPDFRARVRRMAEFQASERDTGFQDGLHHDLTQIVIAKVEQARAAGVSPESAEATPFVDELVAAYAQATGRSDDADFRRKLLNRLEVGNDPAAERYWQLLATINGWPAPPALTPVFEWFIAALGARE